MRRRNEPDDPVTASRAGTARAPSGRSSSPRSRYSPPSAPGLVTACCLPWRPYFWTRLLCLAQAPHCHLPAGARAALSILRRHCPDSNRGADSRQVVNAPVRGRAAFGARRDAAGQLPQKRRHVGDSEATSSTTTEPPSSPATAESSANHPRTELPSEERLNPDLWGSAAHDVAHHHIGGSGGTRTPDPLRVSQILKLPCFRAETPNEHRVTSPRFAPSCTTSDQHFVPDSVPDVPPKASKGCARSGPLTRRAGGVGGTSARGVVR